MTDIDLISLAASITSAAAIQLGLAAGVSLLLRRPVLEGVATGQAILAAAFGCSFYTVHALGTPIWSFLAGGVATTAVFIWLLRLSVFTSNPAARRAILPVWLAIAATSAVILVVRLLTPEPQAGYSIYQAWNPLYLDASFAAGRFIDVTETAIGPGFLGDTMLYPIDMLGLTALISYVTGLDTHAANLGSSIAPVIGAVAILAYGLRRSPWAVFLFCGLFLGAWRYSSAFAFPTIDNSNDHLIYLCGAIALYYLCCGSKGAAARRGSAVLLSMSAIARPYGAAYAAVIGLMTFSRDLKDAPNQRTILGWAPVAIIAVACAARELYLVATAGIFAARSAMADVAPPSFTKSFYGILYDLGIVPADNVLRLGFPAFALSAVVLVILFVFWRERLKRHPRAILIILAPLAILLAPILVEIVTGYRKYTAGSKLFIVSLFLFPWYPCWLASRLRPLQVFPPILNRAVSYAGIAAIAVGLAVAGWKADRIEAWYTWATGTYRANNTDRNMALTVREAYADPGTYRRIVETPILYTHYEPGAGIRYFLGGAFFADKDLWSIDVQTQLDDGMPLADILANLGWPNIYLSFPTYAVGYGQYMPGDGWRRIAGEMSEITASERVERIVRTGNAALVIFEKSAD